MSAPSSSQKFGSWKSPRTKGVTGARFGYNPNSSSLGMDVTALIWGSLMVGIVSPLIGSAVRLIQLKNKLEVLNPVEKKHS